MTRVPLLLLDVDGVLNALSPYDDVDTWPEWRVGWAAADGRRWPIRWAPAAVERLRRWHEQGIEMRWLTTWGHEANRELRALLGLPELPVAGTYGDADVLAGSPDHGDAAAHAAVAPSAPDPLTGRWWKYDIVRRLQRAEPDRLLVWVDDELHAGSPFRRWADREPDVVAVGPDPYCGLAPADLLRIAEAVGTP